MASGGLRPLPSSPVVNRYFIYGVLYWYDGITIVDLWIGIHKYLHRYVQRVTFSCYMVDFVGEG